MTPELPLSPSRLPVRTRSPSPRSRFGSTRVQLFDVFSGRFSREEQVRAGIAVRYRKHVECVDLARCSPGAAIAVDAQGRTTVNRKCRTHLRTKGTESTD